MAIKWNLESIKIKLLEIHGDKYDYSNFIEYKNLWQEIDIVCKIHGPFTQCVSNHLKKGTNCPKCAQINRTESNKKARVKFENLLIKFNRIHNDKYTYIEETYVNSVTPMKIICPIHGPFLQKPSNHSNGKGCPECGKLSMIKKLRFTDEEIKTELNKINDYEFDVSTYSGTKQEMEFICPTHGPFWQKPMNQLRMNAGCPKCSTSKAEKELMEIFPSFSHRDRFIINPLEIDLLCEEFKFGIEFNGWIWHSFGKTFPNNIDNIDKNKHLYKTEQAEQKGYQLFHILDIDWNDPIKKEIWLSVINSKMGKTEKTFARKTTIVDLTNQRQIVKTFLNHNHLQGMGNYKYAYGLINEHERLLAVMTFGKPIEDSSEYEIKRFCTLLNCTVVGGASKLLKYFEIIHKPKSLLSYAKRDWSMGNLYEKLGFEFIGKTEPSKFYLKGNKKYSRQKFQKQKLNDRIRDGLLEHLTGSTAQNIMFNNGYRVYFDAGNLKYIKRYT